MIIEKTFYTVRCDGCDMSIDEVNMIAEVFQSPSDALEYAAGLDWLITGKITHCPKCLQHEGTMLDLGRLPRIPL